MRGQLTGPMVAFDHSPIILSLCFCLVAGGDIPEYRGWISEGTGTTVRTCAILPR